MVSTNWWMKNNEDCDDDWFLPHTESEEVVDSVWILAEIFDGGQQSERRLAETLQRSDYMVSWA